MLNFLENHDELRIASQFFAANPLKAIPALVVSACLNTNPMMIYAGQELGEPGMDEEGFSGLDGRTTIFDYWSPDTLRRWYNEGTFGPTDELNREQLCTILWRYAVTTDGVDNSAKANLEDYPDSKRVSDFAKDAISWCIATGIFEDRDGRLDAWQPATRAELAVMLSRYLAVAGK